VTLELKNDLKITGKLEAIDENMNFTLGDISVAGKEQNPYLVF